MKHRRARRPTDCRNGRVAEVPLPNGAGGRVFLWRSRIPPESAGAAAVDRRRREPSLWRPTTESPSPRSSKPSTAASLTSSQHTATGLAGRAPATRCHAIKAGHNCRERWAPNATPFAAPLGTPNDSHQQLFHLVHWSSLFLPNQRGRHTSRSWSRASLRWHAPTKRMAGGRTKPGIFIQPRLSGSSRRLARNARHDRAHPVYDGW